MSAPTSKPIRDVRPGDRTESGISYISEAAEQPDGTWSVLARYPSGQREVLDFDSGDAPSEVAS